MESSTARSERITAIVSTLVAVAILAAGVTAHQSGTTRLGELDRLASDFQFQVKSAFRQQPREQSKRLATYQDVLQAYQASPQTAAEEQQFADWLHQAISNSMPGTIEPLPEIPMFGQTEDSPEETANNITSGNQEDATESSGEGSASPEHTMLEPVPVEDWLAEDRNGEPDSWQSTADSDLQDRLQESAPPEAILATQVGSSSTSAEKATDEVSVLKVPVAEEQARINLAELKARIAGYHEGLHETEVALLATKEPELIGIVQHVSSIEALAENYTFVSLYYQALTDKERSRISPPRNLELVLEEAAQLVNQYEQRQQNDWLGEFDSHTQEQLNELRQKLLEIASRVEQ